MTAPFCVQRIRDSIVHHRGSGGKRVARIKTERKGRYSFEVFNALPTIVMNPGIARDPEQDLPNLKRILRRVGEHDQAFWDHMATMIL